MNKDKVFLFGSAATALLLIAIFTRKYWWKTSASKKVNSILFVGDSITAAPYSYSALIKDKFPGKKVDILAKGGMRTQWMLDNLKTQLKNNRYDRVYIWGGVNDMFSAVSFDKALANIQEMVDMVRAQGGNPYVITGYNSKQFMDDDKLKPTSYVPTKEGMIALKNRYIQYQSLIPSRIKNATIVPEFTLSPTNSTDGIHPSAAAHKSIADTLSKNIN